MKDWIDKSYMAKWFLTIFAITAGVYLGFRYLLPLVFPFFVAYFLAWIIRPITELLYRKLKIPRVIGGSFSLLLLVGLFGTAFFMLVNILLKQAIELIRNLPVYLNLIADKLDHICGYCDGLFGLAVGTIRTIVDDNIINTINMVKTDVMPNITKQTVSITVKMVVFIGVILIVLVAAVLMSKEVPSFREKYQKNSLYNDIHRVTSKLTEAGHAFLRCQLIIMSIVAIICVGGLYIIHNEYAVLLGIGIALMDALPILGSGMVFIPWAIIKLINGDIITAAILITIYLICQIIREILEPKLIGNRIGIKPLYTLIAMYIGVKLFSVLGFFLGPVGLLIIITVYKVINEKAIYNEKSKNIVYDED